MDAWAYQDGRVILEDADGMVVQFVEGGDFTYRDENQKVRNHTRVPGFWDMRMTTPVHPSSIRYPATVIWEPPRRNQ